MHPDELLTHQVCRKETGCGPRGCGKPIAFRKTRTGAKIPLDPVPVPEGNVAIVGEVNGMEGVAEVLAADRLDAWEGPLYASHFGTCTDGAEFRKTQQGKPRRPAPAKTATDIQARQVEDWIEGHAAAFYWDVKDKGLDEAGIAALWKERAPGMFRQVRDPRVRVEARQRVSAKVRERLGLPPRRSAA